MFKRNLCSAPCSMQLKLSEPGSGEEFDLDVGRWMSRQKEDCDVWRELSISRPQEPPLPGNAPDFVKFVNCFHATC